MNDVKKSNKGIINGRALTSSLITFCFVIVVVTGLALFITPPGRVANWTGWRFLGLTKQQWSAVHISFSLTFMIVSIFHIYLNWRPLLNCFKSRITRKFALRLEWVVALALSIIICAGTLGGIPPFSSLLAFNESIKNSWEERQSRAPVAHAELLSLEELASNVGVELESIMKNLKARGITGITKKSIVGEIAEKHGMTPNALYSAAVDDSKSERGGGRSQGGGMGRGRMTLESFCTEENLPVDEILLFLKNKGFNAQADMKMRDIAYQNNIKPPQLIDMIRNR
jgi:Domain of unknown function (DUF4405)